MESIILAIIIGLISVMTSRLKGDKKEPKKTTAQPKKPASSSVTDVYKEAKKEVSRQAKRVRTETQEKYEKVKKEERATGRLSRYEEESRKKIPLKAPAEQELEIGSDDLVKGLILSEILAPPKALRRK